MVFWGFHFLSYRKNTHVPTEKIKNQLCIEGWFGKKPTIFWSFNPSMFGIIVAFVVMVLKKQFDKKYFL